MAHQEGLSQRGMTGCDSPGISARSTDETGAGGRLQRGAPPTSHGTVTSDPGVRHLQRVCSAGTEGVPAWGRATPWPRCKGGWWWQGQRPRMVWEACP